MREVGCEQGEVIIKSDQEPAMLALLTKISEVRASKGGGRCIFENSPVHSSGSNGVIERAIQAVEEIARVVRNALEKKWKTKIIGKHVLWAWLFEYGALLLNRMEVSKDGKTAYERSKGKKARERKRGSSSTSSAKEFGGGKARKRQR